MQERCAAIEVAQALQREHAYCRIRLGWEMIKAEMAAVNV